MMRAARGPPKDPPVRAPAAINHDALLAQIEVCLARCALAIRPPRARIQLARAPAHAPSARAFNSPTGGGGGGALLLLTPTRQRAPFLSPPSSPHQANRARRRGATSSEYMMSLRVRGMALARELDPTVKDLSTMVKRYLLGGNRRVEVLGLVEKVYTQHFNEMRLSVSACRTLRTAFNLAIGTYS